MKKVIDGKLYDTETAECLGNWDNGYYYDDFNYCEETLYRTKKGRYFLYGKGGAMSGYRTSCGQNSWGGGSGIVPLSEGEAKEWAEEHLSGEEYEEIFEVEEA